MGIDRVVLHIGLPKTASTTIQDHLATHREDLLSKGILYPRSPGNRNHLRLAMYAAPADDITDLRLNHGISDSGDVRRFRSRFSTAFSREVQRTSATTLVLSNEHCGLLPDVDAVQRFANLVRQVSADVSVVVYLRRQDDAWLSSYSEYVKSGGVRDLVGFGDDRYRKTRDYWSLLQRWEQVFGKSALEVRVFENEQLTGHDILVDFAEASKLPLDVEAARSERQNPSLDAPTIEFLRRLNRFVPRFVGGKPNPARGDLVDLLRQQGTTGQRFTTDQATADAYMAHFAESNRRVAKRYLQRSDGRLFRSDFSAPTPEDADPADSVDLDTAIELTALLWEGKQEQLSSARRVPVRRRLATAWQSVRGRVR